MFTMPDDFVVIPSANRYAIRKDGTVIQLSNGAIVPQWKNAGRSERWMVSINTNSAERSSHSIAHLLGTVFIPIPDDLVDKFPRINFKDDDEGNHALDNLEWRNKMFSYQKRLRRQKQSVRLKHNLPVFTESNTGYYPYAIPCPAKEGFYYLPNVDDPLVISKEGKIYDLEKQTYAKVNINGGYIVTTVYYGEVKKLIYVHREVAKMFVEIPIRHSSKAHAELEVNHKNGKKDDPRYDNLEWVTPKENIEHAVETGLINYKAVLAKNILTGKITSYDSAEQCSRDFGIPAKLLTTRLISGKAGTITHAWCVFKYNDNVPWPVLKEHHRVKTRWNIFKGLWYARRYCKDSKKEIIVISNSRRELATALGVEYQQLQEVSIDDNHKGFYEEWTIWEDDDPILEVYQKVVAEAKNHTHDSLTVKVTDTNTLESKIYPSLSKAARSVDIKPKHLSDHLKRYDGMAMLGQYKFEIIK